MWKRLTTHVQQKSIKAEIKEEAGVTNCLQRRRQASGGSSDDPIPSIVFLPYPGLAAMASHGGGGGGPHKFFKVLLPGSFEISLVRATRLINQLHMSIHGSNLLHASAFIHGAARARSPCRPSSRRASACCVHGAPPPSCGTTRGGRGTWNSAETPPTGYVSRAAAGAASSQPTPSPPGSCWSSSTAAASTSPSTGSTPPAVVVKMEADLLTKSLMST